MTTPSLVERVRHGLSEILHRPADPEREREWAQRESEIEHERHESVVSPVTGVRGTKPHDFGVHRRH